MESITESYRGLRVGDCNALCLFASWLFFFGMSCLGWRGPGARFPSLDAPPAPALDVSRSVETLLDLQLCFSMIRNLDGAVLDALRGYGVFRYDYEADVPTQVEGDVFALVESLADSMRLTHAASRLMVDTAYTYLASFVGAPDCTLVNDVLRTSNFVLCGLKEKLIPTLYAQYPSPRLERLFSLCRDAPEVHAFVPYYVDLDRRYLGKDNDDLTVLFFEDENDLEPSSDFLFYDEDDDNYLTQENYNDADLEF